MGLAKTFLYSIAAGFILAAGAFIVLPLIDPVRPQPSPSQVGLPLRDDIYVRDQISVSDVAAIKANGYRTLIALRPDGEVAQQPTAAEVGGAAKAQGLAFAYIPTPHGEIPASVPEALAKELALAQKPVLLYCRTGKRAARVWALSEASRSGGANADEIINAVTGVSQPIDDLLPQIKERIAARGAAANQASAR